VKSLKSRKRKVQYSAGDLREKGAQLEPGILDQEKLGVLMLDASEVVHDDVSPETYIVRVGDTACEIAERFKVTCKQLRRLNSLDDQGRIYRGQRLKLPVGTKTVNEAIANDKSLTKSKNSKWEVAKAVDASSIPVVDKGVQALYFFTHHNFYAITQYNHSVLYAMAVHDLSEAINTEYLQSIESE
jgi:LysM repeat protein